MEVELFLYTKLGRHKMSPLHLLISRWAWGLVLFGWSCSEDMYSARGLLMVWFNEMTFLGHPDCGKRWLYVGVLWLRWKIYLGKTDAQATEEER